MLASLLASGARARPIDPMNVEQSGDDDDHAFPPSPSSTPELDGVEFLGDVSNNAGAATVVDDSPPKAESLPSGTVNAAKDVNVVAGGHVSGAGVGEPTRGDAAFQATELEDLSTTPILQQYALARLLARPLLRLGKFGSGDQHGYHCFLRRRRCC